MNPIPDPSPEKAGLPEFMGTIPPVGELAESLRLVKPYQYGQAVRAVAADEYVHRMMFFALVLCFVLSALNAYPGPGVWTGISWVVLLGWVVSGFAQAGLWQDLARASQMIEGHPGLAEHVLSLVGERKMVPAAVRVNYFYRLALLRFRQKRYGEAAAIADDLIGMDHKAMAQHRANLLLMRTECALRMNDLVGAYRGLAALHPMKLSLLESLQRLLLRTLYETQMRRYDQVVYGWKEKLASADLMPQAQCRMMHEMMETGAREMGMPDLAHWLGERGKLLG